MVPRGSELVQMVRVRVLSSVGGATMWPSLMSGVRVRVRVR